MSIVLTSWLSQIYSFPTFSFTVVYRRATGSLDLEISSATTVSATATATRGIERAAKTVLALRGLGIKVSVWKSQKKHFFPLFQFLHRRVCQVDNASALEQDHLTLAVAVPLVYICCDNPNVVCQKIRKSLVCGHTVII